MKKILVSACLMGYDCRYAGDNCKNEKLLELSKDNILIPVCPEQLGGLSTPRLPAERVGDKIIAKGGKDVSVEYNRGADFTVEIAKQNNVDYCIMKSKSPSCGKGLIYDGTFTGGKTEGNGVTVEKLLQAGFKVISEEEL
ncbi:MAG: DUF523 domain-containing protein [Clostridia bacterium]|nr:DUF523 domain-containing protein [Clostridia bacterium]